jgi:hypothetical protein
MINKLEEELDFVERITLQEEIKLRLKDVKQLKCDLDSIYNFVFSRCTELLQDRIKAHPSFVSTRENSDPFQLLQIIRELVHAIESNAYVPMAIHDTIELIITMR